ncbi:MAG: hypothetical protein ACI4SA_03005, partial [Lachnospiraceae bacterium]
HSTFGWLTQLISLLRFLPQLLSYDQPLPFFRPSSGQGEKENLKQIIPQHETDKKRGGRYTLL